MKMELQPTDVDSFNEYHELNQRAFLCLMKSRVGYVAKHYYWRLWLLCGSEPGIVRRTSARELSFPKGNVNRHLAELENEGLIKITRFHSGRRDAHLTSAGDMRIQVFFPSTDLHLTWTKEKKGGRRCHPDQRRFSFMEEDDMQPSPDRDGTPCPSRENDKSPVTKTKAENGGTPPDIKYGTSPPATIEDTGEIRPPESALDVEALATEINTMEIIVSAKNGGEKRARCPGHEGGPSLVTKTAAKNGGTQPDIGNGTSPLAKKPREERRRFSPPFSAGVSPQDRQTGAETTDTASHSKTQPIDLSQFKHLFGNVSDQKTSPPAPAEKAPAVSHTSPEGEKRLQQNTGVFRHPLSTNEKNAKPYNISNIQISNTSNTQMSNIQFEIFKYNQIPQLNEFELFDNFQLSEFDKFEGPERVKKRLQLSAKIENEFAAAGVPFPQKSKYVPDMVAALILDGRLKGKGQQGWYRLRLLAKSRDSPAAYIQTVLRDWFSENLVSEYRDAAVERYRKRTGYSR